MASNRRGAAGVAFPGRCGDQLTGGGVERRRLFPERSRRKHSVHWARSDHRRLLATRDDCGLALMAKAAAMARLWRLRTGEGRDLSLDLRRIPAPARHVLRQRMRAAQRLSFRHPADPSDPFLPNFAYVTRDRRWIRLIRLCPREERGARCLRRPRPDRDVAVQLDPMVDRLSQL